MLPCICSGQRTCGQQVPVAWSVLFCGKGTCFCHTGCPNWEQMAIWVTKSSTVICSWVQFFVDQLLGHHNALYHNKSVHQHIIHCTSAKQTIAVKRSTSANTNTSSLAAKKHPLSRFGFSYMPEFVHDQIVLSCFNCVSIFIGKKKIDWKSLVSLKKPHQPTWKVIASTLLQRDKMFDLTGTFICEYICRAKITLKQEDFRAEAVLGLRSC